MTEIEKLKEQIKKQEKCIESIKTERLYPALELLSEYKINLAKAECPFEVGDIISRFGVVCGVLQEPIADFWPWSVKKIKKNGELYKDSDCVYWSYGDSWKDWSKVND